MNSENQITILGAGLVGSLLSVYLGRRGYDVHLIEKRDDPRQSDVTEGRSINLAISVRGLNALSKVSLAHDVLEMSVPMRGRMIHSLTQQLQFQPYGLSASECIYSVSRNGLNQLLLDAAERTGQVNLEFGTKVEGYDPESNELRLALGKETRILKPERFIATDGSGSIVRNALLSTPGFVQSETVLGHGYKELVLPAGPNGAFLLEKNALHIWPRGTYMLIALPNFDGSFTCTLFLPTVGPLSFESLRSPQDIQQLFENQFPDLVAYLPLFIEQFIQNPTGQMSTVHCYPWRYEDKALLMGDAAHAIVPFFGQGMNCGFEDCEAFDACLDEMGMEDSEFSWSQVFQVFTERRKRNADAIARMALENFIEMRDRVADPSFLLRKSIEHSLEQAYPLQYVSRYRLVSFTRVPYSVAMDAGFVEDEILDILSEGIEKPEQANLRKATRLIEEKLQPVLSLWNDRIREHLHA